MTRISVQAAQQENHENSLPESATIAAGEAPALSNSCTGAHPWAGAALARRLVSRNSRSWTLALAALLLSATAAQAQAVFSTPQPVGATSGEQNVTVTALAAGTVAGPVKVLTQGASGLDFAEGIGANGCDTATFTASGQTCTESVTFTPTAPGLRIGAVVLLDSGGAVLGTTLIYGTGSGGLGVLMPGNLIPVAGSGNWAGAINDGFLATSSGVKLYWPTSQVLDGAGNLYIADSLHNRIRMVCGKSVTATIKGASCTGSGIISTIAGNGNSADTGDNGLASAATLNDPSGLAIDGAGNLYIADTGNNVIREITAATGVITTIAGIYYEGIPPSVCGAPSDTVGDGCLATEATLNSPKGVTLDGAGNLYIADTNDHRIRLVSVSTGDISTIAGTGATDPSTGAGGYTGDKGKATAAKLNYPYTVAFDLSGNMYIPDSGNNVVRQVAAIGGAIIANSIITTFAGTGVQGSTGDGAAATAAELDSPYGVAVDAAGNVIIADTGSHAVRRVNPATGYISTLLKTATGTYYYSSAFTTITLGGPTGLYLDGAGNLYIADSANMIVRELQGNFAALQYLTIIRQGNVSATLNQTVENDGNAALDLMTIVPSTNAAVNDSAITVPCVAPGTLAVDADCAIGAVFAPSKTPALTGNKTETPTIAVAGDSQSGVAQPSSPLIIQLVGIAAPVNGTTVVVTSNNNPSGSGQSVTFTATVTTGAGTGNLTGTVTFYDGATTLQANVALLAPGTTSTATFTTTMLTVGAHSITASYNGDAAHFASLSTDPNGTTPPLIQNVREATTTALNSSLNPSAIGQSVTFTATVSISGGGGVTPDGTVTFYDGDNALQTVNLTPSGSSGTAILQYSALTQGLHSITAPYSGGIVNPQVQHSPSNTVDQDVLGGSSVVVASGSPNASNYGQLVTFTATVTPTGASPATGDVKFYYGATLLGTGNLVTGTNQTTITYSGLPVGTDNITAQYVGDVNNASSTSTVPYQQTVNKTQTSTTVTATPQPNGIAGGSVTITATVKVIAGSATTTGLVIFTSGTTTLGQANLNTTTGTASITLTNVPPATYSIVATYQGDSNDDGSVSTPALSYTVVQATTQTAVTALPNPALVQAAVTFTAKVTGNGGIPTGSVIFSANGTQIGAPAQLDGTGTATLSYSGLAAGTYTITAVYSGDTDNQGDTGTDAAQLVIGKIPTTTDLGSSTTSGSTPQVILVAAVLPGTAPVPTGAITFKYGTTLVGSATLDSNGLATLVPSLPLGAYTIVAVYSGDALHSPSTSLPITISGTASGFNLAVTPATVTMATKQNATVTVTLTSIDGFADSIGLGCASLPPGVTCHFSAISAALAANGTATAQLTIDTNNPLTGGTSAMNSHAGNRSTYLAGLFLPFSLFFGWMFWRFRKRYAAVLTVVLLLVLSGAAMLVTGCGGFTSSSAKPGTYVIQVTGTGANSNVIHYQNVTLTIT